MVERRRSCIVDLFRPDAGDLARRTAPRAIAHHAVDCSPGRGLSADAPADCGRTEDKMTRVAKVCRVAQSDVGIPGALDIRITRRTLLSSSGRLGLIAAAQAVVGSASAMPQRKLVVAPGRVSLVGGSAPQTDVW